MEEAIREAIEDAKAPRMRYKARNGELRSRRGENYHYSFRLEKLWEPKDDTPVKIQIDSHNPKRVIETDGTVINLATETPLPEQALQVITLYEDTSWLLQKLLNAVTALQETPSQMGEKMRCYHHQKLIYVICRLPALFIWPTKFHKLYAPYFHKKGGRMLVNFYRNAINLGAYTGV